MKRNWMAWASLALCGVLAAALALQNAAIGGLRAELADSRQETGELTRRLHAAETGLEELRAAADRPAVRFANPVLHPENRTLTVDIRAELPERYGSDPALGFCEVGEPYRMAWQVGFFHREDEGYVQTVTFPLHLEKGIELRLEDDTVLFSGDPVVSMLPLQVASGGTSWHYNSREQMFYQCDWSVDLTDPAGQEVQAVDGAFRVYRNGALVFQGREIPDSLQVEAAGERMDSLGLPCSPGDRMRLSYACKDAFGLRYEFPLFELAAKQWDSMERCPLSGRPTVTWPD